MMLIGTWSVMLEGGRLALPHSFRYAAADGLTVTRGFDHYLQAFPSDSWHALARRVSNLPLTADSARTLRRMIFGAAADLSLDALDGLCIPRPLLAYAGISTQAVLVGCDTFFEIWSPEAWHAATQAPAPDRLAGLVAGLASSGAPAAI